MSPAPLPPAGSRIAVSAVTPSILRVKHPEPGDHPVNLILGIIIVTFALLAGFDYLFHRAFIRRKKSEAESRARAVVEDAERQVEIRLKELDLEAQEKADAAEAAFEQEMRRTRTERCSRSGPSSARRPSRTGPTSTGPRCGARSRANSMTF